MMFCKKHTTDNCAPMNLICMNECKGILIYVPTCAQYVKCQSQVQRTTQIVKHYYYYYSRSGCTGTLVNNLQCNMGIWEFVRQQQRCLNSGSLVWKPGSNAYVCIEDTSTWTLHCLNRAHGPTKKHFCSCPAHEDIGLKWSHLGLGKGSLLLNQTSLTFWATQTWLRGYYFFTVCWIQDSQTPGLPDAWILELESWLWLAAAWERGGAVAGCWWFLGGTAGPQKLEDPKK